MRDQWGFSVSTIHNDAHLYNSTALVSTSDQ
jgi:hypothetical protein